MDLISYNGYGVDLGDFDSKDLTIKTVISTVLDNASDLYIDSLNDVSVITPYNTDEFKVLCYIPNIVITPVEPYLDNINLYTTSSANYAISDRIISIVKDILQDIKKPKDLQVLEDSTRLDDCDLTKFDLVKCNKEILEFVNNNASYVNVSDFC